ncbi:hypothetical protein PAAG_03580 [Paracoccidioides lutzii Pb01]|uniref:Uncharacterized protein n=1 Tax=Paracoccidioides lutzii (strain ATCC MYA-826 / Pb01) TaxID=502779 RepID=C1GXK6_PARBA|nr:hypothetical protein PAAG_03580 [Paracoccidioides lutzii Pb01]EEH41294.1 hypothetical protein PAAG_03580 [Paracoccidioides lutzii Pb01]
MAGKHGTPCGPARGKDEPPQARHQQLNQQIEVTKSAQQQSPEQQQCRRSLVDRELDAVLSRLDGGGLAWFGRTEGGRGDAPTRRKGGCVVVSAPECVGVCGLASHRSHQSHQGPTGPTTSPAEWAKGAWAEVSIREGRGKRNPERNSGGSNWSKGLKLGGGPPLLPPPPSPRAKVQGSKMLHSVHDLAEGTNGTNGTDGADGANGTKREAEEGDLGRRWMVVMSNSLLSTRGMESGEGSKQLWTVLLQRRGAGAIAAASSSCSSNRAPRQTQDGPYWPIGHGSSPPNPTRVVVESRQHQDERTWRAWAVQDETPRRIMAGLSPYVRSMACAIRTTPHPQG